jgi:hypothetical protein
MSHWIIIRTDARKEAYVARQIDNAGFSAWHPVQVIACRPAVSRRVTAKAQLRAYREIAILPRRVFASLPVASVDDLNGIRHLVGIEFDGDMRPVVIPDSQIAAFRAVIDAENTAALALSQKASRKQKAKWRDLKEALLEMIDGAKAQLEQAA